MKAIYKMKLDCGRSGTLGGMFVEDIDMVDALIESEIEVYFGEVLGKHSEVYGSVSRNEMELVTTSTEAIKVVEDLKLENGYNPFNYTVLPHNLPKEIEGFKQDDWYVRDAVKLYMEKKGG